MQKPQMMLQWIGDAWDGCKDGRPVSRAVVAREIRRHRNKAKMLGARIERKRGEVLIEFYFLDVSCRIYRAESAQPG